MAIKKSIHKLMRSIQLILSAMFITLLTTLAAGQNSGAGSDAKASKIISDIIRETGSGTIPNTVDVIKEGSPDTRITGIVTTMFATMDVLKQAVSRNCNLIIAHEPLYYNHLDETSGLLADPVFLEKQKYIRDHKLVIWRFHDYIHSMKPDGIDMGMAAKLGWKEYEVNGSPDQFKLPETTLDDLLKYLKTRFSGFTFNVVGNPDLRVTNVRLAAGAPGSTSQIRLLEKEDTDVLLTGESPQWETYEYARDAVSQGRKKAVIFLGHIASEQAGMDYCADWLKSFIKGMPVYFIESGPSFRAY